MYSNNMALSTYGTELPFRQSVAKFPSERTAQDLTIINGYLKNLEALSSLRESHIRHLCKTIRYEIHDANHVLFSFGKRTSSNQYRINECVVLESSEMLVIDYPELDHAVHSHESLKHITGKHNYQNEQAITPVEEQQSIIMDSSVTMKNYRKINPQTKHRSFTINTMNDIPPSMIRSSHSRASDTSSAYSGSDVMQSSTNGEDLLMINNGENSLGQNDDGGLSRCISAHETDDESETSSEHSFPIHDHIRESLLKEANERTDDDIEAILECLLHFPAFANLTLHVRRELCKVLVYAQVEKAQTVVMNDGERYDSWSVIINGIVDDETIDGQLIRTLTVGQSFGCGPTLDQYCHTGIMKTRVDNCQFVVVAQNDYYAILNQGEKNIRKIEEDGKIVIIKEIRMNDDEQNILREIVIKATTEKLLDLLVEELQLINDPNYVQDFLLTYRTFLDSPIIVTNKLLKYFDQYKNSIICEHIARVVLSWVNNHYNDFETNIKLYEFLEIFDDRLENHEIEHIRSWRHLINLACYTKATIRNITLTRSTRDDVLNFNILGGTDTLANNGIFVSKVEKNSKAYEAGLRRGDQILSVNGQCFDYLTHARALEILRCTTHLSLTVKNNLMGLNDIVHPEKSPGRKKRQDMSNYEQEIQNRLNNLSPLRSTVTTPSPRSHTSSILMNSPSDSYATDNSSSINQIRPPLLAITPAKSNLSTTYTEKTKPRPLTKRMGFKRAVMQRFKMTKHNK
ncbi:unnamed protein product [Rotaria sordida]|uniref:Uncharacterized protein n=1 Tax=Rotaria sordida TaxID=392033 RepID=A0A814BC38_9BILA|nr:unnamed protein product [Rotaria sordida]CAF0924942.1 unnamed protein product [Rotaria sordida]CAF0954381.1 unnamed protein product [Rotaria sordida]